MELSSKWPLWPQTLNLTSDLKSATLITWVSMCILLVTVILVTSDTMETSKWPQRSHLASESNSVASKNYVTRLSWSLNTLIWWLIQRRRRPTGLNVFNLIPPKFLSFLNPSFLIAGFFVPSFMSLTFYLNSLTTNTCVTMPLWPPIISKKPVSWLVSWF